MYFEEGGTFLQPYYYSTILLDVCSAAIPGVFLAAKPRSESLGVPIASGLRSA
jgi:hypothetical protein